MYIYIYTYIYTYICMYTHTRTHTHTHTHTQLTAHNQSRPTVLLPRHHFPQMCSTASFSYRQSTKSAITASALSSISTTHLPLPPPLSFSLHVSLPSYVSPLSVS